MLLKKSENTWNVTEVQAPHFEFLCEFAACVSFVVVSGGTEAMGL